MSADTQRLKDVFNAAAETLTTAQDLSPRNDEVAKAVQDFIDLAIGHPHIVAEGSAALEDGKLQRLKVAFLEADREMEKYWAEKVIEQSAGREMVWDDLDVYPWFKDYPALYDFEKRAIEEVTGPITKDTVITYIGSGALPIIPLMLHKETGCQIECIDINEEAVGLSQKIVEGLGMGGGIHVHLGDGETLPVNKKSDVLFLANAPLGARDAMIDIVRDLEPDVIFARSSSGGTEILYPSVQPDSLEPAGYGLAHYAEDHEHNTHTGLVYKKGRLEP